MCSFNIELKKEDIILLIKSYANNENMVRKFLVEKGYLDLFKTAKFCEFEYNWNDNKFWELGDEKLVNLFFICKEIIEG